MATQRDSIAGPIGRLRSYVGANAALLLTGGLGAAVFVALLILSAGVYDAVAQSDGISGLDQPVLEYAMTIRSPAANYWVTVLTNLGDTEALVVMGVVITGLMYWRWRRRSILTMAVVASTGGLIFTSVGKTLVGRNRPPLQYAVPPYEYAPSFPSGHTLNNTVVAATLAYLVIWLATRAWVRLLAVMAALLWAGSIGLSRIFLGHHWLTDVVFGWAFGLAWLALVITVHRVLLRMEWGSVQRSRDSLPPAPPET